MTGPLIRLDTSVIGAQRPVDWDSVDSFGPKGTEAANEFLARLIEHLAKDIHLNLPESLTALHGEELIEAASKVVVIEEQTKLYFETHPSWRKLRAAWVRQGFLASKTEEDFDQNLVQAVLREMVRRHDNAEEVQQEEDRDYIASALETMGVTAFTDYNLMKVGRVMWERSYARGYSDEKARDHLVALSGREVSDTMNTTALFCAKWAVHAFQRLQTSHTFAAALMCSDMGREVLDDIEEQWSAFMVIIPSGMLVTKGLEFTRVLVVSYSFESCLYLMAPTEGHGEWAARLESSAPTLAELLASDEKDLATETVSERCLLMAKRLVAGLMLNLQEPSTHKIRKVPEKSRGMGAHRTVEPEHRIVTIGTPIDIDCRPAIKAYIDGDPAPGTEGARRKYTAPTVQHMVRGHYRQQACGPRHTQRRKTWIRPHWHGPEAALIQTRAKGLS